MEFPDNFRKPDYIPCVFQIPASQVFVKFYRPAVQS